MYFHDVGCLHAAVDTSARRYVDATTCITLSRMRLVRQLTLFVCLGVDYGFSRMARGNQDQETVYRLSNLCYFKFYSVIAKCSPRASCLLPEPVGVYARVTLATFISSTLPAFMVAADAEVTVHANPNDTNFTRSGNLSAVLVIPEKQISAAKNTIPLLVQTPSERTTFLLPFTISKAQCRSFFCSARPFLWRNRRRCLYPCT